MSTLGLNPDQVGMHCRWQHGRCSCREKWICQSAHATSHAKNASRHEAYNFPSQARVAGGMNPGGMPMQRNLAAQAHQQLRRKDPGMGMTGYPPQQKSRRL
ncbi:hypothetical protein CRYUN_Cryun07bG0137600 [Craigia yunnanensis]